MSNITERHLLKLTPSADGEIVAGLIEHLPAALERYTIDTPLRMCHFLAQAAHETAGFCTLEEYASGQAYEGRKDLGNTRPGDGKRFKGRGIFQLTGRANYKAMSAKLGVTLIAEPALAMRPDISVLTACEYWKSRGLNRYADRNDIRGITRRINGGYNGLADRKRYFARAWAIWGGETAKRAWFGLGALPTIRRGAVGPAVKQLQAALGIMFPDLEADGIFGPATHRALRVFQRRNGLTVDGIAGPATWAALKAS